MIRVRDLEASLDFFCNKLGLKETKRSEYPNGKFTLVFLSSDGDPTSPQVELTYNWGQKEPYSEGRNFGHLAYAVENIYETCQRLQESGVTILRPPKDGRMAFVRSPDQISVELLQDGDALPPKEPWVSMGNTGTW